MRMFTSSRVKVKRFNRKSKFQMFLGCFYNTANLDKNLPLFYGELLNYFQELNNKFESGMLLPHSTCSYA